jgi:type II secretory pathway pseudopilin PulG
MRVRLLNDDRQAGDTIIEVLLSITVLALVLGAAYVTSNHSLQAGTDANSRAQALSYAQDQVERIKTAALNGTLSTGSLPPHFCFPAKSTPTPVSANSSNCKKYDASQYSMDVTYSGSVFKVIASWDVASGAGRDQLTIYYKPPGT